MVRSSPGFAKTAIWGSNQVELWPGMVSAIRVNHLSPERGTGVREAELATAAAALGDGASQATAFRPRCGLRSMTSSAKRKSGPRGSSPRVKKTAGARRSGAGDEDLRRRRGGAHGPGAVVVPRVPGPLNLVRGRAAETNRGLGRSETRRRREIVVAKLLTGSGSRIRFRRHAG